MTEKEFLNKLRKATLDVNESYKELEAYRKEEKNWNQSLHMIKNGDRQIMMISGNGWHMRNFLNKTTVS